MRPDPTDATKFFEAGGRKEWLKKPVDIDDLSRTVELVMMDKVKRNPGHEDE